MSVLNQSGEEQVECPLCMEPLEVDDLNFYPCTCGYQICRFCWHRIRTDENGLCPACRKAYSENPADFTPLSKEQVAQLKAEKRQRDQQRKAKLSESRKHLASVRVVQKNLVFVVGLPVRLADPDILKRHEYFGKFGKIHKVVINQSTAYAGAQGPSASAYVTYVKSEDALRAIQNVNNIVLDGRMIKTSLGTTKYCSHFMKNQPCPKADCMYLHDFGDLEASFTKEQMHMGKHQEYEKKLHEALLNRAAQQQNQPQPGSSNSHSGNMDKHNSTVTSQRDRPGDTNATNNSHNTNTNGSSSSVNGNSHDGGRNHSKTGNSQNGKDPNTWPTLSNNSTTDTATTTTTNTSSTTSSNTYTNHKSEKQKSETKSERVQKKNNQKNKNNNNTSTTNNNIENSKKNEKLSKINCEQNNCQTQNNQKQLEQINQQTVQSQINLEQSQQIKSSNQQSYTTTDQQQKHIKDVNETTSNNSSQNQTITSECIENLSKIHIMDDNSSFFSHNTFQKIVPEQDSSSFSTDSSSVTPHSNILNDNLPDINSSEDWQAAFGFTNSKRDSPQIDLLNSTNRTLTENSLSNYPPTNYDTTRPQNCYNKFDCENVPFKLLDLPNERSLNSNNAYININQKLPDNGLNGLDQHMSKFFAEFHKQNQQKDIIYNGYNNGYLQSLNDRQNFLGNQIGLNDNQQMLLLNQYHQRVLDKHLEDQAIYNLKHNIYQHQQQQQQQQQYLQNHATTLHHNETQQFITNGGEHYLANNGQNFTNIGYTQNTVFQNQTLQRGQAPLRDRLTVDDELGFDPFHETQKALAELIESEQSVGQLQNNGILGQSGGMASHGSGVGNGGPVNGLVHGAVTTTTTSHLPPPPGFMQHSAHMNSFGSKILPFLNMSSSQQISNSGGWSNNYSEGHLKGLASVNDWTTLDPAIVSSSRHFPLATLQSLRDQYNSPFQQQNGPIRASYDFTQTNGYANNYSQQQQHNMQSYTNNYNTLQNSLNWFANNDIHNQISSPPGFRASSNTKTQEC